MSFDKITEKDSLYDHLDQMDTEQLLRSMNQEDQKVATAVQKILPEIKSFIEATLPKMEEGGRLFYIGAGTSGRLGILDASECPPTFGVSDDRVIGLIAGGDQAIRKAVENAEDNSHQAYKDLEQFHINSSDTVIGIAASGTTPYVLGGLTKCKDHHITTGAITCNPGSPIHEIANHAISPVVGPEFVTGSSRMKAGTAQKMILNMISTSLMIRLGHVKGNKMVDMQLSNDKLVDRGTRMIVEETGVSYDLAQQLLKEHRSVRAVVNHIKNA